MKKWEYKMVSYNSILTPQSEYDPVALGILNNLGLEGWELVGIAHDPRIGALFTYYFKREKEKVDYPMGQGF